MRTRPETGEWKQGVGPRRHGGAERRRKSARESGSPRSSSSLSRSSRASLARRRGAVDARARFASPALVLPTAPLRPLLWPARPPSRVAAPAMSLPETATSALLADEPPILDAVLVGVALLLVAAVGALNLSLGDIVEDKPTSVADQPDQREPRAEERLYQGRQRLNSSQSYQTAASRRASRSGTQPRRQSPPRCAASSHARRRGDQCDRRTVRRGGVPSARARGASRRHAHRDHECEKLVDDRRREPGRREPARPPAADEAAAGASFCITPTLSAEVGAAPGPRRGPSSSSAAASPSSAASGSPSQSASPPASLSAPSPTSPSLRAPAMAASHSASSASSAAAARASRRPQSRSSHGGRGDAHRRALSAIRSWLGQRRAVGSSTTSQPPWSSASAGAVSSSHRQKLHLVVDEEHRRARVDGWRAQPSAHRRLNHRHAVGLWVGGGRRSCFGRSSAAHGAASERERRRRGRPTSNRSRARCRR